jgi:hypothetical protein
MPSGRQPFQPQADRAFTLTGCHGKFSCGYLSTFLVNRIFCKSC